MERRPSSLTSAATGDLPTLRRAFQRFARDRQSTLRQLSECGDLRSRGLDGVPRVLRHGAGSAYGALVRPMAKGMENSEPCGAVAKARASLTPLIALGRHDVHTRKTRRVRCCTSSAPQLIGHLRRAARLTNSISGFECVQVIADLNSRGGSFADGRR